MELKQEIIWDKLLKKGLLIVPYGIETYFTQLLILHSPTLLIVPYGIETFFLF